VILRDLNSIHGCEVNGSKIRESVELKNFDKIRFGEGTFNHK